MMYRKAVCFGDSYIAAIEQLKRYGKLVLRLKENQKQ